MSFNSIPFLVFLSIAFGVFLVLRPSFRNAFLLVASYVFYGWLGEPTLLVVLAAITGSSFILAPALARLQVPGRRRLLLTLGICFPLSLLVYFKYLPFLAINLDRLLGMLQAPLAVKVPSPLVSIALSFYVFQSISYLLDVYFRMLEPETNLVDFALYLAFFPKLLQGPIERGGQLLPQLKLGYRANAGNIQQAVILFTFGMFKKVVVADRLALMVNQTYGNPGTSPGLALALATYAYALQIYFDFSGYTDMALGAAQLFGIRLTDNFDRPYLARNCAEYWRRWHITLSRWILDYLFGPLQMGFRAWGKAGTAAALLITFLVCGIWHGASWGYVVWGGIHGTYLAAGIYYRPHQKRWLKRLGWEKSRLVACWQILVTFNLVSFTFIFFRADSLGQAWLIVHRIMTHTAGDLGHLVANLSHGIQVKESIRPLLLGQNRFGFMTTLMVLVLYLVLRKGLPGIPRHSRPWRWSYYYVVLASILFLGAFNATTRFIYVQF